MKTIQILFLLSVVTSFAVSDDMTTNVCEMKPEDRKQYSDCLKGYLPTDVWEQVLDLTTCCHFSNRDDVLIEYLCNKIGIGGGEDHSDKDCVSNIDEKLRWFIFNEHCYEKATKNPI